MTAEVSTKELTALNSSDQAVIAELEGVVNDGFSLSVPPMPEKQPIAIVEKPAIDPKLLNQATGYVTELISKFDGINSTPIKDEISDSGKPLCDQAQGKCDMLQATLKEISQRGDDGGPLVKAMMELRSQIDTLHPDKFDWEGGSMFSALKSLVGFSKSKITEFFQMYESADEFIAQLVETIKNGKEVLRRDNLSMEQEIAQLKKLGGSLLAQIHNLQGVDTALAIEVPKLEAGSEKRTFFEVEVSFDVKQRLQDVMQVKVAVDQAIQTMNLIQKTNIELMKGVDRVLNVTMLVFRVAVVIAVALANQKIVLNAINAINETTESLMLSNAGKLNTQVVATYTMAADTMISMDTMKRVHELVAQAYATVDTFKATAIGTMSKSISELSSMIIESETRMRRTEKVDQTMTAITG